MNKDKNEQFDFLIEGDDSDERRGKTVSIKIKADLSNAQPDKLGKAIRLPVPDFSDPERNLTCLEVDFPIAQVNELSKIEVASGPARKRIYCMSKWWARRSSSVFRSMLIAAATEAPSDANETAKLVWEHYYCNHQKAKSFKGLRVLDPFMGGGTTLVEGSRMGMDMNGVDLNPVAWLVVKNELACSDPEQVKAFFKYIEQRVKPQIQPFYTTTCPRGHRGRWIENATGETVDIDPIYLPLEQRHHFRWEGPEIIYTFWGKHGPCSAKGCGHRTPMFRTPVIAEKKLSVSYVDLVCPNCGTSFHAELGETRMAPGVDRIVSEGHSHFTEMSQTFAKLLHEYDKGNVQDTIDKLMDMKDRVQQEHGLFCPSCGEYAGRKLENVLERHAKPSSKTSERKKKDFGIKTKSVQMFLLIHPDWLKGVPGFENGSEMGGWAGATAESTSKWNEARLKNLKLIEVRGNNLPDVLVLEDNTRIETNNGTTCRSGFVCSNCGRESNVSQALSEIEHTAPVAVYAFQCHCPQCEAEGFRYGGRYFKTPDDYDVLRLNAAELEWANRSLLDLSDYWPRQECWYSYMAKQCIPHGYNYWWKMFNSRQLLVHTQLLKAITEASEDLWPLDVREQALGAWQEYSRHQSMFCFWDIQQDCLAPMLANANFHPKNLIVENNLWLKIGRANWASCMDGVISGAEWSKTPTELFINENSGSKSLKVLTGDPILFGSSVYCGSSTELSMIGKSKFDMIITDPPFGDNLFYADLSDFFYVWLRIPLLKWYEGLPEAAYFQTERTPHSLEAIDNPVEHPDDREAYEKDFYIEDKHLLFIREITGDDNLNVKYPNPLYRPQPSSDFYSQTLSAVWAESGKRLKDGGIMAFTFHHNEDQAWIDILKALFDAGYLLVATYPIRSDDTKGDNAAFGSRKIEYDIIHVCRKRINDPEPVSWSRMRRWVKEESTRLKELLEHTHGKTLPESDLRVILRGKSLEFYSRHYGTVYTGEGELLDVRNALLGINELLDDLLEDTSQTLGLRPPENAEPISRLYLRIFRNHTEIDRDELHKTLRGTGVTQGDFEVRGWIRSMGKRIHIVPIHERFAYFTERGRNRKVIKTDLDQAHFLIGAAFPSSGLKIESELNNLNFRIKKSVDDILKWYVETDPNPNNRRAAGTAAQLVEHWRSHRVPDVQQLSLFDLLEEDE